MNERNNMKYKDEDAVRDVVKGVDALRDAVKYKDEKARLQRHKDKKAQLDREYDLVLVATLLILGLTFIFSFVIVQ